MMGLLPPPFPCPSRWGDCYKRGGFGWTPSFPMPLLPLPLPLLLLLPRLLLPCPPPLPLLLLPP